MNYLKLAEFKAVLENNISNNDAFREMLSQTFTNHALYLKQNNHLWNKREVFVKKLSLINDGLLGKWNGRETEFKALYNNIPWITKEYPKA